MIANQQRIYVNQCIPTNHILLTGIARSLTTHIPCRSPQLPAEIVCLFEACYSHVCMIGLCVSIATDSYPTVPSDKHIAQSTMTCPNVLSRRCSSVRKPSCPAGKTPDTVVSTNSLSTPVPTGCRARHNGSDGRKPWTHGLVQELHARQGNC